MHAVIYLDDVRGAGIEGGGGGSGSEFFILLYNQFVPRPFDLG